MRCELKVKADEILFLTKVCMHWMVLISGVQMLESDSNRFGSLNLSENLINTWSDLSKLHDMGSRIWVLNPRNSRKPNEFDSNLYASI